MNAAALADCKTTIAVQTSQFMWNDFFVENIPSNLIWCVLISPLFIRNRALPNPGLPGQYNHRRPPKLFSPIFYMKREVLRRTLNICSKLYIFDCSLSQVWHSIFSMLHIFRLYGETWKHWLVGTVPVALYWCKIGMMFIILLKLPLIPAEVQVFASQSLSIQWLVRALP